MFSFKESIFFYNFGLTSRLFKHLIKILLYLIRNTYCIGTLHIETKQSDRSNGNKTEIK